MNKDIPKTLKVSTHGDSTILVNENGEWMVGNAFRGGLIAEEVSKRYNAHDDLIARLRAVSDELAEVIKDEKDDRSVGIVGWDALHQSVSEARALLSNIEGK